MAKNTSHYLNAKKSFSINNYSSLVSEFIPDLNLVSQNTLAGDA